MENHGAKSDLPADDSLPRGSSGDHWGCRDVWSTAAKGGLKDNRRDKSGSYLAVESSVAVSAHHRLGAITDQQRAFRVPVRVGQERKVLWQSGVQTTIRGRQSGRTVVITRYSRAPVPKPVRRLQTYTHTRLPSSCCMECGQSPDYVIRLKNVRVKHMTLGKQRQVLLMVACYPDAI